MSPLLPIVYVIFFFSGAAALMYEVLWVRSLSLIFGGTHLAVTTVLTVFMGGLALGGFLIGRRVDGIKNPLRFYGYLEMAIALCAVIFLLLVKIYPAVYIAMVQGREDSQVYLSMVRVLFATLSLIVPTTLMGATLPVLTRFVSGHPARIGTHLSYLYGFNTLGAVAGTVVTGFLLLRFYSVATAYHTAIVINVCVGLASMLIPVRHTAGISERHRPIPANGKEAERAGDAARAAIGTSDRRIAARLVLLGISVSGFCALGYEVLWTRILTLTIGTSVYGFAIMLAAFLTGIALGSKTYGFCLKLWPLHLDAIPRQVRIFGFVQLIIGLLALAVTFYIRDLPVHAIALHEFFLGRGLGPFSARQWANLTLAFAYMVGPAFCMGVAFPIAGNVNAAHSQQVGKAVGRVLAFNTLGAILGSAVSGYLLIYVFGIERSLQLLTVVNIGLGVLLLTSPRQSRVINWSVTGVTVAVLVVLALRPDLLRMWDEKYFAIFQNNQPEAYNTPERKKDALENTDVLFYHEGINSTISVIKIKGGNQAVLVNGKVVASSALKDRQCQLTLGHLPMLAHKNPRKVLVVGLGTGMTLGAVSAHPGVEELTLVEIEPNVIGAARTFGRYNNHVLDHPKLKVVFNDGRNFLLTTRNSYDVITADPIHPWTQGSGYLYTTEYFQLAAAHLAPGGVMCQWLPIYELSVADLKSVVKTFSQNFKYTMAWLTQYDAELIGSNQPLIFDETLLAQRLSDPAVAKDLTAVMMGTSVDFLSYFIMGSQGMVEFGRDGIVNTDDNLYLEFSTPASVGRNVMQTNVEALSRYRENILAYLMPESDPAGRKLQIHRWTEAHQAAVVTDQAHALFLGGNGRTPQFQQLLTQLEREYKWFSPVRFLIAEHQEVAAMVPRLIRQSGFLLRNEGGQVVRWEISAVMARSGKQRAAAVFVDNAARVIYGQRYFSGPDLEQTITRFSADVMKSIQSAYAVEVAAAQRHGQRYPDLQTMKTKTIKIITDLMRR